MFRKKRSDFYEVIKKILNKHSPPLTLTKVSKKFTISNLTQFLVIYAVTYWFKNLFYNILKGLFLNFYYRRISLQLRSFE